MLFNKLFAVLLRHAACYADNLPRMVFLNALQFADFAQNAFFRAFAHAAGINNDNIRIMKIVRFGIAHFLKLPGIVLGIAFVHLAAVIEDKISFSLSGINKIFI